MTFHLPLLVLTSPSHLTLNDKHSSYACKPAQSSYLQMFHVAEKPLLGSHPLQPRRARQHARRVVDVQQRAHARAPARQARGGRSACATQHGGHREGALAVLQPVQQPLRNLLLAGVSLASAKARPCKLTVLLQVSRCTLCRRQGHDSRAALAVP